MATNEDQPEWDFRLLEVSSGCGEGISIMINCNGKRMIVNFLPLESLDSTIEGPLIKRYEAFIDGAEEEELVVEEIVDMIFDVGKPSFARLAPPVTKRNQVMDLHSIIYPETFYLRFATIDDIPPPPTIINNNMELPRYSSNDIQVLEVIQGEGGITKVLVDEEEMCFKSGGPYNWTAIEREYECLSKVAKARHTSSLRIPKLTGIVISAENGQVIGILEEFIPTDLENLCTLRDVEPATVSYERRKKWATQIREMVDLLHEIGIVWGDGKPHNVLIHGDTDDAWLIDFGGSWTDGWVDEEVKETLEGDEQAVERIFEFLEV
ncbi:hypothetical protein OCU04_007970 [Sclerotinia nivalis]|uniref:Protein kinase domain-containing protein n=1 Tax=Sclerotinia nivalis TaxID=352851 RepID=A0A9X0AK22_9HELO|nr:hypothetical protein OCU04_007970 [Sclerotinia nivalis]